MYSGRKYSAPWMMLAKKLSGSYPTKRAGKPDFELRPAVRAGGPSPRGRV